MEIRLNDQPLDVTIAADDTLGQVVRDLESWLSGSDLVLCSVRHRDRELLARPEEEWASIPHGQVDTLQVTVKPAREVAALNLQTVGEYLDRIGAGLAGEAAAEGSDAVAGPRGLPEGYSAMADSLAQHFPDSAAAVQALAELLGGAAPQEPAGGSQAMALIQRLRGRVALRLLELTDPPEALRTLSGSLQRCIEEVTEVSILLQTGRNRQAMEVMVRFSELTQELIRLVGPSSGKAQIDGKSLREFYQELNGVLAELVEAFDARDSVLIGDLMEYEVAPRLQDLRSFLLREATGV